VLFVGLLLGLLAALHATGADRRLLRRSWVLLAVTLAQGALGWVQYFTGLPRALVSFHMLGACVLVVALAAVVHATRDRSGRSPGVGPDGTGAGARTVDGSAAPATGQLVGT
jgi:cytochrome c oxidase assembly protein subunit 15